MLVTHCILIINGAGHVRQWTRGSASQCADSVASLPANGWEFYAMISLL